METAWEVLRTAGVPDGAVRPVTDRPLDDDAVVKALEELAADSRRVTPHERECLGAWLSAFRHHWPDRYASLLGSLGDDLLARCTDGGLDRNRYLKLRRIAIENLTGQV